MKKKLLSLSFAIVALMGLLPLAAQTLTEVEIDQLVTNALKTFDVPGMAVAVIKDGLVVHEKKGLWGEIVELP